jgi:hypothetical protein
LRCNIVTELAVIGAFVAGRVVGVSRPLRIEFAGALYHVTARGNERKAIVRDDYDREQWSGRSPMSVTALRGGAWLGA